MDYLRVFTYLDEDEVGAGFGEANCDGPADAAGGAGDYGGVALEGEEAGCHGLLEPIDACACCLDIWMKITGQDA